MGELTVLMLIFAIGLYVVSLILKRNDISWLSFFMSICSIGATLSDETLTNEEITLTIMPVFFVMLMSGLTAMGIKNERR